MKKWSFALLALLSLPACGPDNVGACELYVEHFNSLPCVAEESRLDPVTNCPESLNFGGLDCVEYYDCLTENTRCEGDVLVTDDAACTGCQ